MTINLDHTLLPVNDVDKSRQFYRSILGLKDEP
jgi:catechol 2,3-dioxygenase-like lactoylglutathione lyase family enzyme